MPAIRFGDIRVLWNTQLESWEFTDGQFEYSLAGNPDFNSGVISKLEIAKRWLVELNDQIEAEIKKHLEGWCEWTGEKHVVCIDVSEGRAKVSGTISSSIHPFRPRANHSSND